MCPGTLNCRSGWVSDIFPALGTSFLLSGCSVHPHYERSCLALLYFVLSCLIVVSQRSTLFWWEMEGEWIRGRDGEAGKSGGPGNCAGNVLYERRIYLQFKKKKSQPMLQSGKHIMFRKHEWDYFAQQKSRIGPPKNRKWGALVAEVRKLSLLLSAAKSHKISEQSSDLCRWWFVEVRLLPSVCRGEDAFQCL